MGERERKKSRWRRRVKPEIDQHALPPFFFLSDAFLRIIEGVFRRPRESLRDPRSLWGKKSDEKDFSTDRRRVFGRRVAEKKTPATRSQSWKIIRARRRKREGIPPYHLLRARLTADGLAASRWLFLSTFLPSVSDEQTREKI